MRQIVFLVMMMLGIAQAVAQNVKRLETYNYRRGIEACDLGQTEEAIEYFNKDIAENPKNGYSYLGLEAIYFTNGEYGRALDAANQAIKLLPRKDTEFLGYAYAVRSRIYVCMGDTTQALADICQAIKQDKMNTDYLKDRAQIYYDKGRLDLADADYRKMIELKPGGVDGYMGLGRNASAQKRWEDAIRQFDIVTKLDSEYSWGYSFRAEAYIGLEKWDEATDDIVKARGLNMNDMKAWALLMSATEPAFSMLVTKIKVQSAKEPNNGLWPYTIACMYEFKRDYAKALEYFLKDNEKEITLNACPYIAECHQRLGNYDEALLSINQALNMDSTDLQCLSMKAIIYYDMGDLQSAIRWVDKVVEMNPEGAWGYYRRGWMKATSGDLEGGLEDETTAIVLEPKNSYYYNTRGIIYLKLGKKDLAESDFRKVIELEDSTEKYECIEFAYHRLGQDDKAKEVMDLMIAKDTTDNENYYNAACLYSLMKDKENALKYLEKALALGWNSFAHMEVDFDMEFLRGTAEYKQLVEKYRQARKKSARTPSPAVENSVSSSADMAAIPFERDNGVCKVRCKINGLPLHFVFDTGASDVTLSMVEATFMMKNGYISGKDVVGSQRYMDANGDVSVGTVINLKNVDFGGQSLSNVRASVVRNQKAPLLLGQSVLGRLGRIEIDNNKSVIRISSNK